MMKLPVFQHVLTSLGVRDSENASFQPVTGGDINESFMLNTNEKRYFVKIHRRAPENFFRREAEGLQALADTNTIAVPQVYRYGVFKGVSYLVLEWVEGEEQENTAERLGVQLARMHRQYGSAFGLKEDNYIGTFLQPNGEFDNWCAFYREKRLAQQMELARKKGRLPAVRQKRMDQLLSRLEQWIPARDVRPSPLHGDLWGGNWLAGPGGEPYLIDPAFFYGHFELDLAFTELFGGFPPAFYAAYQDSGLPTESYNERKELYQLYYLLVHLNAFGETYGPAVDRVLRRYVG